MIIIIKESFAGRKFHGDKLSRTPRAKIKFCEYKLSRLQRILLKFSYLNAIFGGFLSSISRTFHESTISRVLTFAIDEKKLRNRETFYLRNFLPLKYAISSKNQPNLRKRLKIATS